MSGGVITPGGTYAASGCHGSMAARIAELEAIVDILPRRAGHWNSGWATTLYNRTDESLRQTTPSHRIAVLEEQVLTLKHKVAYLETQVRGRARWDRVSGSSRDGSWTATG